MQESADAARWVMADTNPRRVAIDSSVISWKAGQGLETSVQGDADKRREYEAIEQLFDLQDRGLVVLVRVDQVDRETKRTPPESGREEVERVRRKCKETHLLTRFSPSTQSKSASKSPQKSGINLAEGAHWMTDARKTKIDQYISHGTTDEERLDLEVLATVAIADVHTFVTVDYPLLNNAQIKDFVKREDDIDVCRPSQVVEQLLAAKRVDLRP